MKTPHVPKRWSRLTKRDALLLCDEQWTWQGENPYDLRVVCSAQQHKKNWPRLRSNGGDVPDWADNFYCPCCRYAGFTRMSWNRSCDSCPIPREAWTQQSFCDWDAYCENSDSPYKRWVEAKTKKERSKYAFAVAALARAELDKEALK